MEKVYGTVNEVSERYGMSKKFVRQLCHARGQNFASKPNGGKIYINIKNFERFLEDKWTEYLRRIRK